VAERRRLTPVIGIPDPATSVPSHKLPVPDVAGIEEGTPNPADRKKTDACKKAIQNEVKKLLQNTRKQPDAARDVFFDLKKSRTGNPSDAPKQEKEIGHKLKVLRERCQSDADAPARRIGAMLKDDQPTPKDLPQRQKVLGTGLSAS
jgi:hypothetical protein